MTDTTLTLGYGYATHYEFPPDPPAMYRYAVSTGEIFAKYDRELEVWIALPTKWPGRPKGKRQRRPNRVG